ncbi:MAG: hypothetical protein K8R87_03635 [Verrucomicrobia bacterium]|nr:hypothetical protein [Verrucomicrobiota bacterium]
MRDSQGPLQPEDWPWRNEPVNRQRLYDFYARQAQVALNALPPAQTLAEFPGLDSGKYGHWGVQTEKDWRDDRWNQMNLGGVIAGVFREANTTVPKGVCLQIGVGGVWSACIDPGNRLSVAALWKGGFVEFATQRFGLLDGLSPKGDRIPVSELIPPVLGGTFRYHGYYRHGARVIFSYGENGAEMLASPWVEGGRFVWIKGPSNTSPLREWIHGGPLRCGEEIITHGTTGVGSKPYVIDTIELPVKNPWGSLMFLGDHDFFSNGDAAICTLMGDVWIARGLDEDLKKVTWKRFAAGLHQPLGLKIVNDEVYVLGRDQITRLRDLNGDGEADFYECISNAFTSSPAAHDYITGLQCDSEGAFYFAFGNQGICRVKPGHDEVEVLATGLRNPDGIALGPAGEIVCAAQEGDWTPASMICQVQRGAHYGYRGPKPGPLGHASPLCYLPRGIDHSSGGQVFVEGDRWGPLQGQLLHFSYGDCVHFLVLRENIDGVTQGMIVPLPGEFASGAHRGRFNPRDGQLYVSGTRGWSTYAMADGLRICWATAANFSLKSRSFNRWTRCICISRDNHCSRRICSPPC